MNETHEDNLDRVWDIIEKVGITMLTTQFSGGLRARPLEARSERDAGLLWFVTDVRPPPWSVANRGDKEDGSDEPAN